MMRVKNLFGTSRTRTANTKRVIITGFFRQCTDLLFPFLTRTALIYFLGSQYLGLNGLFSSILQVLSLAELGFGEAVTFSLYRPFAEHDKPRICALLKLYRNVYRIVGLSILGIGLALMPFLRYLISDKTLPDINIYILFGITLLENAFGYLFFAYRRILFTADQRSDVPNLVDCGGRAVEFIARMLVLLVLRNYYLYCIASVIVWLIDNYVIYRLSRRSYPEYVCEGALPAEEYKGIRARIAGLFVSRVCYVCRNSFDTVTVSAFLGLTMVSIFQNYYFIVSSLTHLTVLITQGMLASIGNSIATESKEKNYRDFQKFQLLVIWIAGWCTACLLCLYQPFMRLWMGSERMLSAVEMSVFCLYYYLNMMADLCYIYRHAAGLYQHRRFTPVLESVVNITLNIILVRVCGVIGVLLSTIFCQVVINIRWSSGILYDYYFTDQKRSEYVLRLAEYALVTALACAAAWFACGIVRLSGIPELLLKGCICVVVPNFVLFALLRLFPEYADAKRFVLEKILGKGRN